MGQKFELNAWINSSGASDRSWPRKGLQADSIFTLEHYVNSARIARRGHFSNVFMSDRPQLLIDENTRPEQLFDPIVVFSAVLAQVPDIKAVVTATTSYSEPYTLARALQSMNILFPGRISWNIVTSWHPEIAENFSGAGLPDRAARYARAEEFVEVVTKLWESWDYPWGEGELKSYGTPTPIHHKGQHFSVRGPLNLPRTPWGHPGIIQAGGSISGVQLGARYADMIYAPLSTQEASRNFRNALHAAARDFGRSEDNLPRVMPAISPIIFSTEAEAARWKADYAEANPVTEADLNSMANFLGLNRASLGDSSPISKGDFLTLDNPVVPIGVIEAKRAEAEGHSLRAFAEREKLPGRVSTAEETSSFMIDWVDQGAVDGYTISALNLPDDLETFVDAVVPLLIKSGRYEERYA